ncbi:MAG: hypothetical protein WD049_05855, partial [Candidatus Paceibacterota bacterium]
MIPAEFHELLAGVAFVCALILAFFGLRRRLRSTSLRLSAIFFLVTFTLFADHGVTYFAAIFIIATAVTELDFLQNLAAIIRGDKNYFDFRREYLTQHEVDPNIWTTSALCLDRK